MNAFIDLDELVLRCRDGYVKELMRESVLAYKAGAYRSSIVSTWNAIVFDFQHKLKELSLTGDKNAQKKLDKLKTINDGGEETLRDALIFERSILDLAKDEFEFITHLEHTDLSRIQHDRNRCAHPTMQDIGEPYYPTAELARVHIRNAVEIMLQREPVHGKAAIDKIYSEISSEYFPTNSEEAIIILSDGPLKRAKAIVIRNIIVVLIKSMIHDDDSNRTRRQKRAALKAIIKIHPASSLNVIDTDFKKILSNVPQNKLKYLLFICCYIPECWNTLTKAIITKLQKLVERIILKDKDFYNIMFGALKKSKLRKNALSRIKELDDKSFAMLVKKSKSKYLISNAIERYKNVGSFASAEHCGENIILPLTSVMDGDDINKILTIAQRNSQIIGAWVTQEILCEFFDKTQDMLEDTRDEWAKLYTKFNRSYDDTLNEDLIKKMRRNKIKTLPDEEVKI